MLNYNYFFLIIGTRVQAWWQSGYAEDCKSLDAGSIPTQASTLENTQLGVFLFLFFILFCIIRPWLQALAWQILEIMQCVV